MAIAVTFTCHMSSITKKIQTSNFQSNIIPAIICGIFYLPLMLPFGIFPFKNLVLQASLLTNLSPLWVGIGSFLFFKKNLQFLDRNCNLIGRNDYASWFSVFY
jgi:hypothetical protein